MQNVWKRVNESGKNWRIVYKALTLLEYLIRNGSERAVEDGRDHIYQIRTLCDFQHTEPGGVDQGINGARPWPCPPSALAAPRGCSQ